jgi:hypothetical protein
MPDDIVSWVMMAVFAIPAALAGIRWIGYRFAPVKKVRATVVDKNRIERMSRQGTKRYQYAIVFATEGRKLSFYVSEFSYGGYRKGETGTLTYKGDRIIDFQ